MSICVNSGWRLPRKSSSRSFSGLEIRSCTFEQIGEADHAVFKREGSASSHSLTGLLFSGNTIKDTSARLIAWQCRLVSGTEGNIDWLGNEIKIKQLQDPKIAGVVCHLSYFDRGVWDRLGKGNWFENPSNSSISCLQSGPIRIGRIDLDLETVVHLGGKEHGRERGVATRGGGRGRC